MTTLIHLFAIITSLAFLSGCPAHQRSERIAGEVVRLELIENSERAAIAPVVAGALAGVAVDAIKAHLEAEAAKLERQFGAGTYKSDFWTVTLVKDDEDNVIVDEHGTPQFHVVNTYSGFAIRRFTKTFPEKDGTPAMEFVADFKISDNGRLFLVQPRSFITREAKAKVVNKDATLNSTISFSVDAMWIDKHQVMRQERIATASFDVMNYWLGDDDTEPALLLIDSLGGPDARVGWFPGVPVSVAFGSDEPLWMKVNWRPQEDDSNWREHYKDGAFKLTVNVIERDASKAKEYIERAAKYVGEQRDRIVERVKAGAE